MFCPKCGNEIQDGMKFCGKCGNSVPFANEKNNVTVNDSNTNGKRTKMPFLILGGAVALVVVIALIIIVINFNKVSATKTNINNENVTETKSNNENVTKQNSDIKVGDITEFGTYEQDGNSSNGKEPIKWQVLAVENGKALLISKYGLEQKLYNSEDTSMTWEKCSLRKWLNNDFYENAFTSSEKNKIVETRVTADKNPKYDTNPGNSTDDNVFMLSINEVNMYFGSDSLRKCKPTKYAENNGVWTDGNGCCWWWLRSPGIDANHAAYVNYDGSIGNRGVDGRTDAVRPALWIDL